MHLVEGLALRQMLGEWIAVPCGQSALRMSGLISMNETGAFLFSALREEQTEETLLRLLLENYDIDEETAAQDVHNIVNQLRQSHLLAEADA